MGSAQENNKGNIEDTSMKNEGRQFRKILIIKRLKVLVPCVIVMLLLAIYISDSQGDHYGWDNKLRSKMRLSLMVGPLACWIEFSGKLNNEQKVFYTICAFVLVPGILSHALWSNKVTGTITIIASCLWFIWGMAITCIGV